MWWLMREDVLRELRAMEQGGVCPSEAQLAAFEEQMARGDGPQSLTVAGDVAEIRVEGILTKKPSWIAQFFYGANTAYVDLQAALDVAGRDPNIKRVEVSVDSPGGTVDGLFDALAAFEAFDKPMVVKAESAFSAAYAIAAVAGPIEATSSASMFGSVGVAASFMVTTENAHIDFVDLTNSESPDKRPDVRTEEGKAVVVEWLDAIHELFADAIARGRKTTVATVNQDFGRGASFLAAEAKRRKMIDGIAGPSLRAVPNAEAEPSEEANMNLDKLRAQYPELCAALVQEGVTQERDRVCAHLKMGQQSGDRKTSEAAIESGEPMTQTLVATYMAAAINRRDIQARQDDEAIVAEAADGAKANGEGGFGEAVVSKFEELMGVSHG